MDLTGPGYKHDAHDRLVLESKEQIKARGLDSPDDGDALALTFAAPVEPEASDRDDEDEIDEFGWRVSSAAAWLVQPTCVGALR